MKKRIIFVIAALMALVGCEDHRLDGLLPDMVYLPKYGVHTVSPFAVGEKVEESLWAYKRSYNGTSCTVTFAASQAVLDKYNEENGTQYEMLPSNCYTLASTSVEITGKDMYGKNSFTYDPDAIAEIGGYGSGNNYALPIQISSKEVEVVADQDYAIYFFEVQKPLVLAKTPNPDAVEIVADVTAKTQSFDIVFGTGFDNKWSCSYGIETDRESLQSVLDSYNAENGTSFTLLPEAAYAFSQTSGTLEAGQNNFTVSVTVDPLKSGLGSVALPVVLKSVDSPLVVSGTVCTVLTFKFLHNLLDRTGWSTDCSGWNTNMGYHRDELTGGTIYSGTWKDGANDGQPSAQWLIDGDLQTFWHARGKAMGGKNRDDHPWITVDMKENKMLSAVVIDPRYREFKVERISDLKVFVSTDGTNFTEVATVATPWAKIQQITVDFMPVEARYVKVTVEYLQNLLAFSEFNFRGYELD